MSWWCPDCLGYYDPLSDCVMRCDMGRRLDDTDLNNLEAAAHERTGVGVLAHPTDILRLVEEVRWYKARFVSSEYVDGDMVHHAVMTEVPEVSPTLMVDRDRYGSVPLNPHNDAHEQTPPKLFPDVVGYKKDVVVGPNYETVVTYTEMPFNIPMSSLPKNDDGDTPNVVKGN